MKTIIKKSQTLMEFLMEQYPDSPRTRVKKMLQSGNVNVNNISITSHSYQLKSGDVVESGYHAGPVTKAKLPFPVLYEDENVIVIDKPAGIATSSIDGSANVQKVLTEFYRDRSKGISRTFVVHRLDKEVSGILLFAKSEEIMDIIKSKWDETEKHYFALVEGVPEKEEGTIKSWLKEGYAMKVQSVNEKAGGKLAVTKYKIIKQVDDDKYTLLDIITETGRKNQIRVHLSEMGCPIVGDRRYGASSEYLRRVRLHACSLSFPDPETGKLIEVSSPMPKGFLTLKPENEHYK